MKLQVLRWTAAVIFAILFPFVFTQKVSHRSAPMYKQCAIVTQLAPIAKFNIILL